MIQFDFFSFLFFSSLFYLSFFFSFYFLFFLNRPSSKIQKQEVQQVQQVQQDQQIQQGKISDIVRKFLADYKRDDEILKEEQNKPSLERIKLIKACDDVNTRIDEKKSMSEKERIPRQHKQDIQKKKSITEITFRPLFPRFV